jgi:hypothetical protein
MNLVSAAKKTGCGLVVSLMLGGCTVIRVGEGSDVKVRYLPGIAVVTFDRRDRIEVAKVEGLGLSIARDTVSLGWASTQVALVPPGACSLILWKPSSEAAREVSGLLSDQQACIVERGKEP